MDTKKSNTMAQRFGFGDPELSTPTHDALMVWLDSYIPEFLEQHKPKPTLNVYDAYYRNNKWEGRAAWIAEHPLALEQPTFKATWEKPIMNNKYMVGFADMLVNAKWGVVNGWVELDFSGMVKQEGKGTEELEFWFEVKPAIKSVGEVVRQIRMYQEFTGSSPWFVVSPDDRFADILRQQRIGFIKAPSD